MTSYFQSMMVVSIIGAFLAFYFGSRSFGPKGILITRSIKLTGVRAKLVGIICIGLGFMCLFLCGVAFLGVMGLPAARQ